MSNPIDPVAQTRDAVQTAQDIQAIDGRELLADASTTPDPKVAKLRTKLQRRRQRATLRHQHRAARRRERGEDHAAEMTDRGVRALRSRKVATSPARKAANLQRLQTAVVVVALPVIIALGAASTSAVHAFMTKYASASTVVAWGVEPAIIALVSGLIITRALMRRNGAPVPPSLAWIERCALSASVVMCFLGAGVGAVVAPIGAAVVALAVERVTEGIADADLGEHTPTGEHTVCAHEHTEGEQERARVREQVAAEGDAAIAQLDDWRDRDRALVARERMRSQSMAAAAGGAPRALPYSSRTRPDQGSARPMPTPERVRTDDGGESSERVIAAAEAKRLEGLATRERIVAHMAKHPAHTAEQIGEHVGVSASTVRRHKREMRAPSA